MPSFYRSFFLSSPHRQGKTEERVYCAEFNRLNKKLINFIDLLCIMQFFSLQTSLFQFGGTCFFVLA